MILKFKDALGYVTFNDLLIKNVHLLNVSNHRFFFQNRFINECARKQKDKPP